MQLLQSLVFLLYRNHVTQITSTPNRKDPEAAFVMMGVHVPLNVLDACPLIQLPPWYRTSFARLMRLLQPP